MRATIRNYKNPSLQGSFSGGRHFGAVAKLDHRAPNMVIRIALVLSRRVNISFGSERAFSSAVLPFSNLNYFAKIISLQSIFRIFQIVG